MSQRLSAALEAGKVVVTNNEVVEVGIMIRGKLFVLPPGVPVNLIDAGYTVEEIRASNLRAVMARRRVRV